MYLVRLHLFACVGTLSSLGFFSEETKELTRLLFFDLVLKENHFWKSQMRLNAWRGDVLYIWVSQNLCLTWFLQFSNIPFRRMSCYTLLYKGTQMFFKSLLMLLLRPMIIGQQGIAESRRPFRLLFPSTRDGPCASWWSETNRGLQFRLTIKIAPEFSSHCEPNWRNSSIISNLVIPTHPRR